MSISRRTLIQGSLAAGALSILPSVPQAHAIPVDEPTRFLFLPDQNRPYYRLAEENCWTIIYTWMLRFSPDLYTAQAAHSLSDTYRQWIRETPPQNGIPPHITFGGAVTSLKEGDPTFYKRWEERTRARVGEGLIW